jgi:hypothetical protein
VKQIEFVSKDTVVLITDSGVKHNLGESEYPKRREECQAACRAIGVLSLRSATVEELDRKFIYIKFSLKVFFFFYLENCLYIYIHYPACWQYNITKIYGTFHFWWRLICGLLVFRFSWLVVVVAPVARPGHLRVCGRKKSPEGLLLLYGTGG